MATEFADISICGAPSLVVCVKFVLCISFRAFLYVRSALVFAKAIFLMDWDGGGLGREGTDLRVPSLPNALVNTALPLLCIGVNRNL